MLDRVLTVAFVSLVLTGVQVVMWLRVFAPKRDAKERQRIRITYRYEGPVEGCPAHIAGEDVAGIERFTQCGRS